MNVWSPTQNKHEMLPGRKKIEKRFLKNWQNVYFTNVKSIRKKKKKKTDSGFHFLFFLFRAFHSPSWVAKLPRSSFTFLFLSASLKHTALNMLRALQCFWFTSTHTNKRFLHTCSWPRWAFLWPGSESPSWSPSALPWTPFCTCASVAPSLSPLWCCHASFRSPSC